MPDPPPPPPPPIQTLLYKNMVYTGIGSSCTNVCAGRQVDSFNQRFVNGLKQSQTLVCPKQTLFLCLPESKLIHQESLTLRKIWQKYISATAVNSEMTACRETSDRYKAVLLLWIIYVISDLFFLCYRARQFIDALWSLAGKRLTSWR